MAEPSSSFIERARQAREAERAAQRGGGGEEMSAFRKRAIEAKKAEATSAGKTVKITPEQQREQSGPQVPVTAFGMDTGLTVPESVGDVIGGISSGIGRAVASTADALLPGQPVLETFERAGMVSDPKPGVNAVMQRAGERTVQAAEFFVPTLKVAKAGKAISESVKIGSKLPALKRTVGESLEFVAKNPATAFAFEEASGFMAGVSGGTVEQAGGGPTMQLAAEVVGGVVPAIPGIARAGDRAASRALARRSVRRDKSIMDPRKLADARDSSAFAARSTVRGHIPVESEERGREIVSKLATKIDRLGIDVDLAPAETMGKGAATLRNTLMRHDPNFDNVVMRKRAENMVALKRAFDPDLPEGVGAINVQQAIDQRNTARLQQLEAKVGKAASRVQQRVQAALDDPSMPQATRSEIVLEELARAERMHADEVSKLMERVPETAQVNSEPLLRAVKDLSKTVRLRENLPPQVDQVRRLTTADGKVIVRQLEDGTTEPVIEFGALRELDQSINAALGDPAIPRPQRRYLQILKESVQDTLDGFESRAEFDGLAALYREAKEYAKAGYSVYRDADRMAEAGLRLGRRVTTTGKVLNRSRNPVPSELVLEKFFHPGASGRTPAMDFKAAVERMHADGNGAGAAQAEALMDDYIVAKFFDHAVPDPEKGPVAKSAKKFLSQYDEALKLFPRARQKVVGIMDGTLEYELSQAALKQTQREIEENAASLILGADPDRVISSLVNKENASSINRAVLKEIKADPQALAGWRRAWVEHMRMSAFVRNPELGVHLSPSGIRSYVDPNRDMLIEVFGAKQVERWLDMADIGDVVMGARFQPLPKVSRPTGPSRPQTSKAKKALSAIQGVWHMTSGSGAHGPDAAIASARFMRGIMEQVPDVRAEALIERALIDQKFMDLLMQDLPQSPQALARYGARIHGHLVAISAEQKRDGTPIEEKE